MSDCPCCSGQEYANCCEPFITGTSAATTAEQLLRSRYSAHAKGAVDYIIATNHEATRDTIDRAATQKWAEQSEWLDLEVRRVEGGAATDSNAQIEFIATYRDARGRTQKHHELALFEKAGEAWFFRDAAAPRQEQVRREGAKVGRNDPCTCGSGKKYKKCCGKAA